MRKTRSIKKNHDSVCLRNKIAKKDIKLRRERVLKGNYLPAL